MWDNEYIQLDDVAAIRTQPSTVRSIPNVFEKLLYYIAPADALVCGNAYWDLKPIAFMQVRDCLALPKNRMLLLAWPFCMHVREDASNYYKEAQFYNILHDNVIKRSGGPVGNKVNATKMRKFLTGFESTMLECVESNLCFYNNLKLLMLDFHNHDHDPDEQKPSENSTYPSQSAYQLMTSERWGNVIGAVVARCAPELRHFVFVVGIWNELPDKFYTNLKLDCLLAQMQQLETLYIPSVEAYNVAHSNLRAQRLCWQALHDLPIEQRLPNLRRIVVGSSTRNSRKPLPYCQYRYWEDKLRVLASDAAAIHDAFRSDKVLDVTRSPSSKAKLPQFHHSLTLSSTQPQRLLTIEVLVQPLSAVNTEARFERLLRGEVSSETNITCYIRDENKLTLSHDLKEIVRRHSMPHCYYYDELQPESRYFISIVEKYLLQVATYRSQMLSIVNSNVVGGPQTTPKIPACICADSLLLIDSKTAASLLSTLSCGLSPVSLTLQFDWFSLVKHLALFAMTTTTSEGNATSQHWSRCIPRRGELKLELKISNSLQYYINHWSTRAYLDEMCRNSLVLSVDNRFVFPPQVTIEIITPPLVLQYSSADDEFYKPVIREHFQKVLQQFVDDIAVVGDEPINNNTCEALRHLQRVEKLLYDKQFELELLQLFYNIANAGAKKDEKEPQSFMPNLKSFSIVRQVTTTMA